MKKDEFEVLAEDDQKIDSGEQKFQKPDTDTILQIKNRIDNLDECWKYIMSIEIPISEREDRYLYQECVKEKRRMSKIVEKKIIQNTFWLRAMESLNQE